MRILITGGIGFIGTNTAKYFAKNKNNQITIIDNFSRPQVEINASFLKKNFSNIEIIKTDVGDIKKYEKELKKTDVIIHLAGQTAVTTSIKNPLKDFQDNLYQSFFLLDYLRKNHPQTILIYSSTNKVYGDLKNHQLKKDVKNKRYFDICHPQGIDENTNLNFISPYGCSKGATDLYFLDYARVFDLKTVVFRQSCIYGEHQLGVEDQGWVAHFSKQFLFKKKINIFGDGYQVRDLLYVEDLIEAYEKAIKNIKKVKGEVFNIGGGIKNSFSLLQVIDILEKNFGYKIKINYFPSRLGDQKFFVSNNSKIKKLLNWKPKTNFKTGLKKLIHWQKENLK